MPQTNSAKKRLRQTAHKTERHRAARAQIRTQRRNVLDAIDSKDAQKAATALDLYYSALDQAMGKGVIKKNFVSRQKSRFRTKVNELEVKK